jgi:hypothetical protein
MSILLYLPTLFALVPRSEADETQDKNPLLRALFSALNNGQKLGGEQLRLPMSFDSCAEHWLSLSDR